jgi:hypothetical protein
MKNASRPRHKDERHLRLRGTTLFRGRLAACHLGGSVPNERDPGPMTGAPRSGLLSARKRRSPTRLGSHFRRASPTGFQLPRLSGKFRVGVLLFVFAFTRSLVFLT